MSYCRWSTDDFQCDLYVYEHCDGGFDTHVAGNRLVYQTPLPPPIELESSQVGEWLLRHELVMKMVHEAERVRIDLPHAGETFHDDTAAELLDRLRRLKGLGYKFPDYVIEAIEEEAKEAAAKN